MNKCQRCGAFVPVEKAFCPNCSEPMEPEEAPDRAATTSSEMMSTIRDDPEGYRDALSQLKKKPAAAEEEWPAHAPSAPEVSGYSQPGYAPGVAPPVKSGKRYLVPGIAAGLFLIIIFVVLFALKLI